MFEEDFLIDLTDRRAENLSLVGGKAVNLHRLVQFGFNVPKGFVVTTKTFSSVIKQSSMKTFLEKIEQIDEENVEQIEALSEEIRSEIEKIEVPPLIVDSILKKSRNLSSNGTEFAVRSSATAEDLPENSFAGQQDTFLNVNEQDLIVEIRRCWSSLFTSRAISYRKKSKISNENLQLSVVVQEMIFSEVSGIVFTANPISGERNQLIVDSSYGLGEALVSGMVTPDNYLLQTDRFGNFHVLKRTIGNKSVRIQRNEQRGTSLVENSQDEQEKPALQDELIFQLARQAKSIQAAFANLPQDIEWAFYQGQFYFLQTRPITTLFPIDQNGQSAAEIFFRSYRKVLSVP